MRKFIAGVIMFFSCLISFAQQKDFEGIIFYKTTVKSSSELISEKVIKNMLGVGNEMTVWIKQGNYRQVTGLCDFYYINKDQRLYIKFRNLDTLYFLDYTSDTNTVKKVSKPDDKKKIAGFDCKLLTVESSDATRKYYYAPALYMNAEYDKNNTLGRYDVFAKETSSLYLDYEEETKGYKYSQSCTRIQESEIADSFYNLPRLPQKKFIPDELIVHPEFTRSGGWTKYLLTSLDKEAGSKYLKISKGEEMAEQQVMVKFLLNEYGRVIHAEVENKKEVHPKLAEEALRVVNASPSWKPATIYGGEKIVFWQKVPITFQVSKK